MGKRMLRSIIKTFTNAVHLLKWFFHFFSPATHLAFLRIRRVTNDQRPKEIHDSRNYVILVVFQKYGIGGDTLMLIDAFVAAKYHVILVSNAVLPLTQRAFLSKQCFSIIERRNIGHDFGAYKDGIAYLLRSQTPIERLVLMNDSVIPAATGLASFVKKLALLQDFGGATESYLPLYHVQSYCMSFSGKVVADPVFQKFWQKYLPISNRDYAIRCGELVLTKRLLRAGLKVETLYNSEMLAEQLMEMDFDQLYFLDVFLSDRFHGDDLVRYRRIFRALSEDMAELPNPGAISQHDQRILRRDHARLGFAKRLAVRRHAVDFLIRHLSRYSTIHYSGLLLMLLFEFPLLKRNLVGEKLYSLPRLQEALRLLDIEDRHAIGNYLKAAGKHI